MNLKLQTVRFDVFSRPGGRRGIRLEQNCMLNLVRKQHAGKSNICPHIQQSTSIDLASEKSHMQTIGNAKVEGGGRTSTVGIGAEVNAIEQFHSDGPPNYTFPGLPSRSHE